MRIKSILARRQAAALLAIFLILLLAGLGALPIADEYKRWILWGGLWGFALFVVWFFFRSYLQSRFGGGADYLKPANRSEEDI